MEENWVTVIFHRPMVENGLTDQDTEQGADQDTDQVESIIYVLEQKSMSATEIMAHLKHSHRPTFRNNFCIRR